MDSSFQSLGLTLLLILAICGQAHAFGAGNIASTARIEGQNWRHGDIEDALLTVFLARAAGGRKFGKLDVQRVYFGNWLRDYSQAVDIGTLKYVSAEAIRILIWVLGFVTFGYGTKEFEVTTKRLGCYQPTEHIDNPLGYGEGEDGRNYDSRLRGPVDEKRELAIDPRTGLKTYIASEDKHIATSADLVRRTFRKSIDLGRRYGKSGNSEDFHEALRLLGTGLHCLEDYAAHSNYTELALIEAGESEVFPHVGRNTKVKVEHARDRVYPIVTGTFGGVDFFHSVMGEVSDKATQSEVQSLEGVISDSQSGSPSKSFLQDLLSKIPDGLLSDKDDQSKKMDGFKADADNAKKQNEKVSPRKPEEWTRYLDDVQKQIKPVLEWHDDLIKSITEAIENIPVLPDLVEQLQDQMNVFVFSIIAPYVLPIIKQVKNELQTGSSEVIKSSREQQHVVFNDDDCSNPTHSMLSKDHFSNILNEPAGQIASHVVKWTVPQLMKCWDDENSDIDRTLDRIISGVFHHPALRKQGRDGAGDMHRIMFGTVEDWWNGKSERERESLRKQLSRQGVRDGKNHKEGVQDCGHGCGKPISLPKSRGDSGGKKNSGDTSGIEKVASEAAGGGSVGGLVGGLVGGIGSMFSSSRSKEEKSETSKHEKSSSAHGHTERRDEHEERRHQSREEHRNESHPSHTSRNEHQNEQRSGSSRPTHETRHGGHEEQSRYDLRSSHPPSQSHNSSERQGGYGQSHSGSEQQHGYGQGHSSGERQSGYGQSHSSNERQHGGYGQSHGGSEQQHGYGQGHSSSERQHGGYGQSHSSSEQQHGYGQGHSNSERQHGGYGQSHGGSERQGGYGQSHSGSEQQHGYGQGHSSSERQHGGYGQSHGGSERQGGYGQSHSGSEQQHGGYGQSHGGSERHGGYGQSHSGSEQQHGYGQGHSSSERQHGGYGQSHGGSERQGGYGQSHSGSERQHGEYGQTHGSSERQHGYGQGSGGGRQYGY